MSHMWLGLSVRGSGEVTAHQADIWPVPISSGYLQSQSVLTGRVFRLFLLSSNDYKRPSRVWLTEGAVLTGNKKDYSSPGLFGLVFRASARRLKSRGFGSGQRHVSRLRFSPQPRSGRAGDNQ